MKFVTGCFNKLKRFCTSKSHDINVPASNMWVTRGILEKLFTFVGLVSSFNFKPGKKKMTRESGTDRVIDSLTN